MKKKTYYFLTAMFLVQTAFAQESGIITTRRDTVALYKQTTYNTARFLRYMEKEFKFNGVGYGVDIPGLSYTFSLSKNTVIQISESVRFTTTSCGLCILGSGAATEAWFKNSIVIDNEKFATFDYIGDNLKSGTTGGTELAQLGPGTHTIKVHVGISENSGDAFIYGYDPALGNRTFMSLMFFEQ